jgi:hypothetical protein
MKAFLLSVLMMSAMVSPSGAGGGTPAGYVTDLSLTGADAAARTVVVRDGAEIQAKLMMPLYAGDVVFIREPASSVGVEVGNGEVVTLGADLRRYAVEGEIDTGDSTWGILGAISDVFAGEGDQPPENMVSKGGDLKMPMAIRGANMIQAGRKSLWLGWDGGTAPYTVSLEDEAGAVVLASDVAGLSADVELPAAVGKRFTLAVRDARRQVVQLRVRRSEEVPGVASRAGSPAQLIASAALLTAEGKGEWSLEAAQMLRQNRNGAAAALLEKMRTGWRYESKPLQ